MRRNDLLGAVGRFSWEAFGEPLWAAFRSFEEAFGHSEALFGVPFGGLWAQGSFEPALGLSWPSLGPLGMALRRLWGVFGTRFESQITPKALL